MTRSEEPAAPAQRPAAVSGVSPGSQPSPQTPPGPETSPGESKPVQDLNPNEPEKNASKEPTPAEPPTPIPEPPPPEPPVAVVPASFRVESTVPGTVRVVNGKTFGRTTVSVKDFPPGKVTVEVFDKQQGFSKRQTFELKPGDNGVLRFEIGKGRLEFLVQPYATVILDGKELGITPIPAVEVYEGRHSIELSLDEKLGKKVKEEYVVKAGGNHVYTANLNSKR